MPSAAGMGKALLPESSRFPVLLVELSLKVELNDLSLLTHAA
jgi:hypothetical protein